METNTQLITILFLSLTFLFAANSQTDSCSSQLSVTNLPFNTTALHCFTAWNSENFILRYANSGQNQWDFLLSAPDSNSYVSVGFSSNGRMDGSSAVAGWSNGGGSGTIKQYYLGGKSSSSCPPDKGNLNLTPNKTVIVSQSSRLYLAFQITSTSQLPPYLVYAVGPQGTLPSTDGYLATHSNQASSSVNFATGQVSSAASGGVSSKKWHGALAMFGWGVLMPIGILMARYFKHLDPLWFYSHISIQGIGFVLGLIGIIIGFGLEDDLPGNVGAHKALGFFILVFGSLQVLAFLARPDKQSKVRRYWNWYHHYVGRAAVVLSIANVFLGISIAHESAAWSVGYAIYLVLFVLLCAVLEILRCIRKRDELDL